MTNQTPLLIQLVLIDLASQYHREETICRRLAGQGAFYKEATWCSIVVIHLALFRQHRYFAGCGYSLLDTLGGQRLSTLVIGLTTVLPKRGIWLWFPPQAYANIAPRTRCITNRTHVKHWEYKQSVRVLLTVAFRGVPGPTLFCFVLFTGRFSDRVKHVCM